MPPSTSGRRPSMTSSGGGRRCRSGASTRPRCESGSLQRSRPGTCSCLRMDADRELKERLVDGVDGAFELLVRAYQHRLYAFALGLSGNPADAEEIAQDAFLRAYRALGGYRAERIRELRLGAWLHRITLNVMRNRVRRRGLRVVPLDSAPEPADRSLGPEAQVERQTRSVELANLVSGLPVHDR